MLFTTRKISVTIVETHHEFGPPPDSPTGVSGAAVRLALVVLGQACFGLGIGLLFLADLGLGPWDVLHDGLSGGLDRAPGTVRNWEQYTEE